MAAKKENNPVKEKLSKKANPLSIVEKKGLAQLLFTRNLLTQKEVATRVGITEATMSKWVKEGMWDDMRKSLLVTKDEQIRCILDQIAALNEEIRNNKEQKYANSKQADTYIKLTAALKNLYTETGLSEILQVCQDLLAFIQQNFTEHTRIGISMLDAFVQSHLK